MLKELANIGGAHRLARVRHVPGVRFWASAVLCLAVVSCSAAPQGAEAEKSASGATSAQQAVPDTPVLALTGRPDADAFADAQERLARGDYAKVLEEADAVLAKNPKSGLAHEVRGSALLGLDRVSDATAAFRRATEVEPNQSGAWTKLGIVQMEGGDVEGAIASLRKAVEINDADRFAHQRLGLLYESRGDAPKAIEHFERGMRGTSPDYLGVAVNLGRLLGARGRHKEAVALLEPRLPMSHSDPLAHMVLASALFATGRFEDARLRFERAGALDSSLTEARLGTAMALRETGDAERALRILDDVYAERPGWAPVVVERGKTLMKLGRSVAAATAFDEYVALGGDEAAANEYRAQLQVMSAQPGKARDAYAKVLASGKADAETYAKASEVYLAEGDVKQGEQVLRDGLAKYPDNVYLVTRLGAYLAAVTRYDEAVPLFERARKAAPENAALLRMLALARLRRGDEAGAAEAAGRLYELARRPETGLFYAARLEALDQTQPAERVYREVLAQDPANALAANNLASLLGRGEQLEEAERLARQAAASVPGDGRVLDTLGWVLYRRGKKDEAVSTLDRASTLAPTAATVRYHHGVVLESVGRRTEARQALTEAVRLDGDAEWAKDARSRLTALQ
jgi:tetratricopeptide (TPR) repeat protein